MYNGIGLSTVRGSATSGHVSKNLSYIKPDFFRKKVENNQLSHLDNRDRNGPTNHRVNEDVIEHNRKHALEAEVYELEESLRDKGFDEEMIVREVQKLKERQSTRNKAVATRGTRTTDSHEIHVRKSEELQKIRSAFYIDDDFKEGDSFNPEAKEKRRLKYAADRKIDNRVRDYAHNVKVNHTAERDRVRDHTDLHRDSRESRGRRPRYIVKTRSRSRSRSRSTLLETTSTRRITDHDRGTESAKFDKFPKNYEFEKSNNARSKRSEKRVDIKTGSIGEKRRRSASSSSSSS